MYGCIELGANGSGSDNGGGVWVKMAWSYNELEGNNYNYKTNSRGKQ